jgi:site-specific recombinase XerD
VAENGRATVHSLRHTFASLLLQNGGTLPEIQQAIGHTTLNMTRRYAHLETKASAAKLARILTATTASLTVP